MNVSVKIDGANDYYGLENFKATIEETPTDFFTFSNEEFAIKS